MSVHADKRYAYVRHLTRHADTIAAHGYQEKVRGKRTTPAPPARQHSLHPRVLSPAPPSFLPLCGTRSPHPDR